MGRRESDAGRGKGGGAGRARFSDRTFTYRADRASPEPSKACATGRHIRDAVLSVARGGAGAQDYITIRLADVIVSSVACADTAADAQPPIETVGNGLFWTGADMLL